MYLSDKMRTFAFSKMETSQVIETIERILQSGRSFALYRKPGDQTVHLILQSAGEAMPIESDCTEPHGFIFAPFHESLRHPTLLIRPDAWAHGWKEIQAVAGILQEGRIQLSQLDRLRAGTVPASQSEGYKINFNRLMKQINSGRFEKLVLSYSEECTSPTLQNHEAEAFLAAIEMYPNAMVTLVHTPTSGRWMGCSPELLLHRDRDEWQTIALAGTHELEQEGWNQKNIEEQDIVSRYIHDTLSELGANIEMSEPYTARAGHLMHRRTDFKFHFSTPIETLNVIHALHPTPAVCGYPKDDAYKFLIKNERACRNYFSGYLGPINMDSETDVYVNLRCAQICFSATYYHAGGGLTPLSQYEEEALEIENKMLTMKRLGVERT